jgi:hypothetical protein
MGCLCAAPKWGRVVTGVLLPPGTRHCSAAWHAPCRRAPLSLSTGEAAPVARAGYLHHTLPLLVWLEQVPRHWRADTSGMCGIVDSLVSACFLLYGNARWGTLALSAS